MKANPLSRKIRAWYGALFCAAGVVVVVARTFAPSSVLISANEIQTSTSNKPALQTGDQPVDLIEIGAGQPQGEPAVSLLAQSHDDAERKSYSCKECHKNVRDPHSTGSLRLGCTDCHGGDASSMLKERAHVASRNPHIWKSAANPVRTYTLLNHESTEFIRFVNPGDLRVAAVSCGTSGCHGKEVLQLKKSMMTHGCMLWGAAAYNNSAVPLKWSPVGESYSKNGNPQIMLNVPAPTPEQTATKGILPFLLPLPRFEVTQPGNVFRIFERGGRFSPDTGIPERTEEPGRPRQRLSVRGLGTSNRTDPTIIGATKTRLLDPTLNFLGTNDHAGDYRSSGCTACHVIYANDRSPVNSGPYAAAGNRGFSLNPDPTIPKDRSGHPIEHRFTTGIPTSQCIVCHMHPGTNVLNSYVGFMWWDLETDGNLLYPEKQRRPTAEQAHQAQMSDPNEASVRGLWSDPEFLNNVTDLNDKTKHTQFADFHGHGWVYKAVYKKDRKGNLLDYKGDIIPEVTNELLKAAMEPPTNKERQTGKKRPGVPVHQMDVHLEKGMHCVDCHFIQDSHGDGNLYGEVRAAIEIQCIDCHGTVTEGPSLLTTGPAAKPGGRKLESLRTPFGKRRFERRGDKVIQNSMVERDLSWEISLTKDTINPKSPQYNAKASLAKTVRFDNGALVWGDLPTDGKKCAHVNENMSCIACHSAWNPSCFGCHLSQKANKKLPENHFTGDVSRNFVSYNWQTLREDVYMLAKDGDVTGNRIGPCRSACAVHVSSFNGNREGIYHQQSTISAEGYSGIAFSTNVPHTVRGAGETKMCSDCHVSDKNDNNALMAQLLMQGTNYTNFIGRYCWVAAGEHGLAGVVVTEQTEPQAVIGSTMHKLVYPDNYHKHKEHGDHLKRGHEHPGKDIADNLKFPFRKPDVLQVQSWGEYLLAACGEGGLRVFDIAFIDDKAFSERITSAPVSPIGQKFHVPTKHAVAVAAPTTMPIDTTRTKIPGNKEQPMHPLYGYFFVLDKEEGLIVIKAATLWDGVPTNNFLKRTATFNPDHALSCGHSITIVGTYAYICCEKGLAIVSLEDPTRPKLVSMLGDEWLHKPKAVAVQFQYAFILDEEGVKVADVTSLAQPRPVSKLELHDAHNIYVARTYAYVAAGKQGLVILDVENPTDIKVDQIYNANGCINDLHDVKLGITYTSQFAYLADGKNGMRVVQLTSPETPGNQGFSPRPQPCLIATFELPHHGHALSISEGLDRDRAVDESGNQVGVFGRVGARPLNAAEARKLYLRDGNVWKVSDDPNSPIYQKRPFNQK